MAQNPTALNMPQWGTPLVDPKTGVITTQWAYYLLGILNRTGGIPGISVAAVEALAQNALSLGLLDISDEIPSFSDQQFLSLALEDDFSVSPFLGPALMLALGDDSAAPSLNPIAAAILVSDTTP